MTTYILDTHILLWWLEDGGRLSVKCKRIISSATADHPLIVCDISLWEIATLFELERISLAIPLQEWLQRATAPPLVRVYPITPAVAAEVASLPADFHRDPADRIIVATTRLIGATLLTGDERIWKSKACNVMR